MASSNQGWFEGCRVPAPTAPTSAASVAVSEITLWTRNFFLLSSSKSATRSSASARLSLARSLSRRSRYSDGSLTPSCAIAFCSKSRYICLAIDAETVKVALTFSLNTECSSCAARTARHRPCPGLRLAASQMRPKIAVNRQETFAGAPMGERDRRHPRMFARPLPSESGVGQTLPSGQHPKRAPDVRFRPPGAAHSVRPHQPTAKLRFVPAPR